MPSCGGGDGAGGDDVEARLFDDSASSSFGAVFDGVDVDDEDVDDGEATATPSTELLLAVLVLAIGPETADLTAVDDEEGTLTFVDLGDVKCLPPPDFNEKKE